MHVLPCILIIKNKEALAKNKPHFFLPLPKKRGEPNEQEREREKKRKKEKRKRQDAHEKQRNETPNERYSENVASMFPRFLVFRFECSDAAAASVNFSLASKKKKRDD